MIKCPRCRSTNIRLIPASYRSGGLEAYFECKDCKWNEWMDKEDEE
tara:strand:+ start:521 stop:658 length:138 start_codon:yes stop_codon:yes gene_type:complete